MLAAWLVVTSAGCAVAVLSAACATESGRTSFVDPDEDAALEAAVPPPPLVDSSADARDGRVPFDPRDEQVVCAVDPCVVELSAGESHVCARTSDGEVLCWGGDHFGQLGPPSSATSDGGDAGGDSGARDGGPDGGVDGGVLRPRRVTAVKGATQLSAGGAATCARLPNGSVWCWGSSRHGELGRTAVPTSDEDPHPAPAPVALGGAVAARVDVGDGSACAVLSTGGLVCWGRDDASQLARRGDAGPGVTEEQIRAPARADTAPLTFSRTAGGTFTRLALDPNGDLYSWGALAGDHGFQAGRIALISPNGEPIRIPSLAHVTDFVASPETLTDTDTPNVVAHACAIGAGQLYCWGRSFVGALGNGIPDVFREAFPSNIPGPAWPQQLAAGPELSCVRMTDGVVMCAGSDLRGRLGTGAVASFSASFVPATALTHRAVHVVATGASVCALIVDGSVECWGSNQHGELGTAPDDAPHPTPLRVVF